MSDIVDKQGGFFSRFKKDPIPAIGNYIQVGFWCLMKCDLL